MNWDIVEGQWTQFKGAVKSKWAKLTDQDLTALEGKKEQLLGKLQERYGLNKDEAERQVDDWLRNQPPTTKH
ncbi:MAG: CsbD family protein [Myxococcales bacterium]